jgi:alpha-beta hydrolase superfamily lysophospholipase
MADSRGWTYSGHAGGVARPCHGRSAGEPVLIHDHEQVVADFHELAARTGDPALPTVLVEHSMGGMIAARYRPELRALVLSGPVLGRWDAASNLLTLDEIPDTPIDPGALSRDPAVGTAYAADPLVRHGWFARPTLEALAGCLERILPGARHEVSNETNRDEVLAEVRAFIHRAPA